ncbi:magnesium transporter [Sutcliffiella horikoshii]|uniref:Magnesium transporter MgtE n=1 Tax=Sutcliffiella horikoshii TaxID=79883 RepID=A0AA95B7I3_9BACI|nr:magnesium transporter [Sutcliffiella horikoshii]TYS60862.1 magnesium transporter [Sutcliffiella horikoshii]
MVKNMTEDQIILNIITFLKDGKRKAFQDIIEELQPYDTGVIYQQLPEKHKVRFLTYLTIEQLTALIQELNQELQLEVLQKIGVEKSAKVMDRMDNDDLASLFDEMDPDVKGRFLAKMNKEESTAVQDLMKYEAETAGRLMTNRYVWIPQEYTVREVVDKLKSFAELAETINYLYVIDEEKRLVGVVSYRDLILADAHEKIQEIMFSRVISVHVDTDQEEVANIIERYDFLAVPVVDDEKTLIGIITVDDVIDVVIQEANEDIEKLSASGKDIDFDTPALVASARRLPWLILLLFIGLISGSIISGFEDTLGTVVALAFFMPMIAGMTGNTGTQSLAVIVRGLISRDLDKKLVTKVVLRELGVGITIGITCAILIAIIAYVWRGDLILGMVVGVSLFFTLIIGTLAGTIIPLILYKLNIDPAIASGPLITTVNDILSLLIYFGIATAFLSYLAP